MKAFLHGSLRQKSPLIQVVTLILIIIFMLFVGQMICLLILKYGFHFQESQISGLFQQPDKTGIWALKLLQITSAFFMFVLSGLVFAYMMNSKGEDFLCIRKGFSPLLLIFSILLILFSEPLISWLGLLNARMTLPPALNGLEHIMKDSEDKLSKITGLLLTAHKPVDIIINLLMIAIIPAIGEEFIFRACLQQIMIRAVRNPHLAIIITAVIFSAIHFQFYGFLPRFFLGILLGYLFYWSSSIWLSISAHFFNNALAVIYAGSLSLKGKDWVAESEKAPILWQVFISLFLVIGLMTSINYLLRREGKSALQSL